VTTLLRCHGNNSRNSNGPQESGIPSTLLLAKYKGIVVLGVLRKLTVMKIKEGDITGFNQSSKGWSSSVDLLTLCVECKAQLTSESVEFDVT
jgi:hypothetical protein